MREGERTLRASEEEDATEEGEAEGEGGCYRGREMMIMRKG